MLGKLMLYVIYIAKVILNVRWDRNKGTEMRNQRSPKSSWKQ